MEASSAFLHPVNLLRQAFLASLIISKLALAVQFSFLVSVTRVAAAAQQVQADDKSYEIFGKDVHNKI